MKNISILVLSFYRKHVSPILTQMFGDACRFTPTCSEYTIEALEKYGFCRGIVMGFKRLGKCHPWGGFGFDPVN